MSAAGRVVHGWGYLIAVVILGLAIAIEAVFLVPVIRDQAAQSREGAEAKRRQTLVFPVSCKLYLDAHVRGVITDADLRVFETPRRCPR